MLMELLAFAYAAGAVFVGSAGLILLACGVWGLPIPILPPRRSRFVPWGGIEVLAAFAATVLLIPLVIEEYLRFSGVFPRLFDLCGGDFASQIGDDQAKLVTRLPLWEAGLGFPLKVMLVAVLLHVSCDFRPYQLGLTKYQVWSSVALGWIVWIVCALPCNVFHLLFSRGYAQFFPQPPEIHDIAKIAQENPVTFEWILIFLAATIIAPCVEEFLFRGLLLRWLAKGSRGVGITLGITLVLALLMRSTKIDSAWQDQNWNGLADATAPVVFVAVVMAGIIIMTRLMEGSKNLLRWQAILTSSLLFAIAHANVWPTPVALFLLAIGLAWVACRTQSIIPGMVAHSLFNLVACVDLVIGLRLQQPTP